MGGALKQEPTRLQDDKQPLVREAGWGQGLAISTGGGKHNVAVTCGYRQNEKGDLLSRSSKKRQKKKKKGEGWEKLNNREAETHKGVVGL